jgi:hypothetical protein
MLSGRAVCSHLLLAGTTQKTTLEWVAEIRTASTFLRYNLIDPATQRAALTAAEAHLQKANAPRVVPIDRARSGVKG